jgi:hypothetical protein
MQGICARVQTVAGLEAPGIVRDPRPWYGAQNGWCLGFFVEKGLIFSVK